MRNITAKPIPRTRGPFTWRRSPSTPSPISAEVEEFWAVQEVGRVLNPVLAAGQIEGGIAQGIGYALYEKVVLQNGHMANNQMTNYIMPTAEDVPPIHVFFEEIPFQYGGFGAKGIGELPHDGPAPAIVNAIKDATGVSFHCDSAAARGSVRRVRCAPASWRSTASPMSDVLADHPLHRQRRKRARCRRRR